MTIELNHTIIPARDKRASAKFLADILGLEAGPEWSHFVPVRTSNGVTLDYADATDFRRQHYAFLVSESEFDAALSRIKAAGIAFYADFNRAGRGQINHLYGGRGLYFDDPDGHLLEIPYCQGERTYALSFSCQRSAGCDPKESRPFGGPAGNLYWDQIQSHRSPGQTEQQSVFP